MFNFIENVSIKIDTIKLKKINSKLLRSIAVKDGAIIYSNRPILFVEVHSDDLVGYGECAALELPYYTSEYCDQSLLVIENVLVPLIKNKMGSQINLAELSDLFRMVQGHNMAKAALEMAFIDLALKISETTLESLLDVKTNPVPFGAVTDGTNSIEQSVNDIANLTSLGYSRVKVKMNPKVSPGYFRSLRSEFPDLEMFVDANGTFTNFKEALEYFKAIEECDLSMIEQPFERDELLANTRLGGLVAPPICLDEPMVSASAGKNLIEIGACDIPCVKVGRMGGILQVLEFHDILEEVGVTGYIGGNFSSDLGKWVDLVLASLSQFRLIPDLTLKNSGLDIDLCEQPKIVELKANQLGFEIESTDFGLGKDFKLNYIDEEKVAASVAIDFR